MSKQTDFEYGWNVSENDPPTIEAYPTPEAYNQGEPPDVCMGQVFCDRCKKYHGCCAEVQNFSTYNTGENNMIQREGKSQNGQRRRPNQNGLPFLTPKDASRTPQPAKVIAARIEPDNFKPGSQIVSLRLEFKGQHWKFGLRPTNPNLDPLCDAWGDDETRWGQKELMISTVEDMFDDKLWLHFEPIQRMEPEKTEATKSRK